MKNLQFSLDALPEEENKNNNTLTRVPVSYTHLSCAAN